MKIIFIALLWFAVGPGQEAALDSAVKERKAACALHANSILKFRDGPLRLGSANFHPTLAVTCRVPPPDAPPAKPLPQPEPEKVTT